MVRIPRFARRLGIAGMAGILLASLLAAPLAAQEEAPATVYRTPPKVLVDLADSQRTPVALPDPGRRWLLVLTPAGLPPIRELAQRELRLAGLRIDPQTH